MLWKNGGFIPDDGQRGSQFNPSGTVPFPQPQNMPVGQWDGGKQFLRLDPAPAPLFALAQWNSPIFDLRPELRGTNYRQGRSVTSGGFRHNTFPDGVPIWNSEGCSLWVMFDGLNAFVDDINGLDVGFEELASPNNVGDLQRYSDIVDISDEFISKDQKPATVLQFMPIGAQFNAKPIRFWQIQIKFEWTVALAQQPQFGVFSSFY